MAARRRKRAPQTDEYVEGNTVRKVERVPRTRSRKEDISRSGMYPIPLQFGEIRKKRFR